MFPVKEFEGRFRAILAALDLESDGSEDFEELNAEFEDALMILSEIRLDEADWREEFTDALDDFGDLAGRYRALGSAQDECERALCAAMRLADELFLAQDENTRLRRDMLGLRERQFELERRCDGQQRELCALRAQLDGAESPAGTAQSE